MGGGIINKTDLKADYNGIAVFETLVEPGTQVTWSRSGRPINKKNFRFKNISVILINTLLSILKYEQVSWGNWRRLLVKNITETDYTEFIVSARGEQSRAKLVKGRLN